MKRGDYDYNHATSNTMLIVLICLIAMCVLGGLALGLTIIDFTI